jgi:hypothetical protein
VINKPAIGPVTTDRLRSRASQARNHRSTRLDDANYDQAQNRIPTHRDPTDQRTTTAKQQVLILSKPGFDLERGTQAC